MSKVGGPREELVAEQVFKMRLYLLKMLANENVKQLDDFIQFTHFQGSKSATLNVSMIQRVWRHKDNAAKKVHQTYNFMKNIVSFAKEQPEQLKGIAAELKSVGAEREKFIELIKKIIEQLKERLSEHSICNAEIGLFEQHRILHFELNKAFADFGRKKEAMDNLDRKFFKNLKRNIWMLEDMLHDSVFAKQIEERLLNEIKSIKQKSDEKNEAFQQRIDALLQEADIFLNESREFNTGVFENMSRIRNQLFREYREIEYKCA